MRPPRFPKPWRSSQNLGGRPGGGIWRLYLVAALLVAAFGLFPRGDRLPRDPVFDRIIERGRITVITRNNAHCYHIYRGEAMGFEYDLARAFADYLGVELAVQTSARWETMLPELRQGKGDFVAASLTITDARREAIAFSRPYMPIQQHLIVHRNNNTISQAADLAGKTVHVRAGTSYAERLENLQAAGIDLEIAPHPDLPTEELIRMVAEGEIEVTVADSNIAMLNRRYYPQAVVAGPISEKQYLGWAVSPRAHILLSKINRFLAHSRETGRFAEIYNRYYAEVEIFDYTDLATFHQRIETRLPQYLPAIRRAARKHGFDWRWIAAQIYQESHFDPRARSPAGAQGLMQLTRRTARSMGVKDPYHPVQSIRGGVRYLKKLYDFYDKARGRDRFFIALAAYNVGRGHILDARNLARDRGLDPDQWASLTQTLPLLSRRQYYADAKYGYCRGTEPVRYIRQITVYYDILRRRDIEYDPDDPGDRLPFGADAPLPRPGRQERPDGGQQLLPADGLGKAPVRPEGLGQLEVLPSRDPSAAGDGDDFGLRKIPADLDNGFDALLVGHDQVGDDQVRTLLPAAGEGFVSLSGLRHRIPLHLENPAEHLPNHGLVINDQDVRHR